MTTKAFEQFIERGIPRTGDGQYETHPSSDILEAFVYEQLSASAAARVSAHAAGCPRCSETLAALRHDLAAVDGVFEAHLMGVKVLAPEPQSAATRGVIDRLTRWLACHLSPEAFSVPRVVGFAAAAAALIVCANVVLDRVLVPPVDPLAAAEPIVRWWVYLYWLLVPLGGVVLWRLLAYFRQRRR